MYNAQNEPKKDLSPDDHMSNREANCLVNHTEQIAYIDVVSIMRCVVCVKFEGAYFKVIAE